ncbi:MAG: 16S rRNA processing protein RimM [Candidatus Tokpelaia sp. JSC188]|nr:MAG: 16S rRNA processing protein RimM [Candidatus Tokpelaia sp. JSC188]
MSRGKKSVLVAVVGAAHGIQGGVRVKFFTTNPLNLSMYGPLCDKNGKSYQIKLLRQQKTLIIVHFEGINDRTQAEELNGTKLFIDCIYLPNDLEDDEFYQDDLIGFTAFDSNGREMGFVSAFFNFGAGDIVEITIKGGTNQLIPFTKIAIPHIDMTVKRIVINPIASGLESH